MQRRLSTHEWDKLRGQLREKYAQLTDDDLFHVEGREEELIERIQRRTGAAADQIEQDLRATPQPSTPPYHA